ncbi:hypothetical protein JCM15519_06210 [Fundidesulfovibrio butyratiphilus]
MRQLSETEHAILLVAWDFSKVQRYLGIVPERHLLCFDTRDLVRLVDEGLLIRIKLKAFSQKIKGYRITDDGLRQVGDCRQDCDEPGPLAHLEGLLVDVYCVSRLSWNDGVAPKDVIVKRHKSKLRLEAYTRGLIAKVKVQTKGKDSEKGYILTNAGYAFLRGNTII